MPRKILIAALFIVLLALAWWTGTKAAGDSVFLGRGDATSKAAPRRVAVASVSKIESEPASLPSSPGDSLLSRLYNEGVGQVTMAQLQEYLARNHRNAESLLAASRLTGNLALLREAARRFPSDPHAHFELAMRSENSVEKQRSIAELIRTDPGNALGPYLAAHEAFKEGRTDEAVRQLAVASAVGRIDAYNGAFLKENEQAYLAAGFPPTEAKAAAVFGHVIDYDQQLNGLFENMTKVRESYDQQGNADAAFALTEQGIAFARKLQAIPGQSASGELAGLATESRFLEGLDSSTILGDQNITVEARRATIAQEVDAIKETMRGVDRSSPAVTPQIMAQYIDRLVSDGELRATQWLRGTLGLPVPAISR